MWGKLADKEKTEPFTMVPNRLIRSKLLDPYDKCVFMVLASFNPSFPSYEKISELVGASRERVWKSLHKLEQCGVIKRYKVGRSTHYSVYGTSSPDELMKGQPVRYTNYISSPDELEPVRQTNSNNTKEKEQSKKGKFSISEILEIGKRKGVI